MIRTLLVDDDAVNLITMSVLLEEAGHVVTQAESLAQARAFIAGQPFDLAILDMHVGAELGSTLVADLRARFPKIVVALLSGSLERGAPTGTDFDIVLSKGDDPARTLASISMRMGRG